MQQTQFANKVKKQKTETEKTEHSWKNRKFCITLTEPLTRFWKWEDKNFLGDVANYVKENHYEKVNVKMLLRNEMEGL